MKKYQIVQVEEDTHNAGSKAVADVARFAGEKGYECCNIVISKNKSFFGRVKKHVYYIDMWNKIQNKIEGGSIVLLQHPFHFPQYNRYRNLLKLKRKNVHFICLVHDVEALRSYRDNAYYQKEYQEMMSIADVLIVHNKRMKEYFIQQGVSEQKIISLDIFDYYTESTGQDKGDIKGYKNIIIAGNLDSGKSKYIANLYLLNQIDIQLFGPNCSNKLLNYSNIHYHGVKPADELPNLLNSGFGLVWDGDSIITCDGPSGKYLRFNNPHKLSLYIASGIPVIIWKEAAEADFVEKNNLGISVSSLKEAEEKVNACSEEQYQLYRHSVYVVQKQLQEGYYTKKALYQAEKFLIKR
jgi:hypothetical protein